MDNKIPSTRAVEITMDDEKASVRHPPHETSCHSANVPQIKANNYLQVPPCNYLKVPKVALTITIPSSVQRQKLVDLEAQELELAAFEPRLQMIVTALIILGVLISAWVAYMAVLIACDAPPHIKAP